MIPIAKADSNGGSGGASAAVENRNKVTAENSKLSKNFRKTFDSVLQGTFTDSFPPLVDYLNYLDGHITRPFKEYNDCQEALKQCYSATANVYQAKSNKKDGKDAAP